MILRSEHPRSAQAGFSLFETLVSLAILSMVLAVSVSAVRGPSPAIRLQQAATKLQKQVSEQRDQAIRARKARFLNIEGLSCDNGRRIVWFYPNGAATGPDICFSADGLILRLRLDRLQGQYLTERDT